VSLSPKAAAADHPKTAKSSVLVLESTLCIDILESHIPSRWSSVRFNSTTSLWGRWQSSNGTGCFRDYRSVLSDVWVNQRLANITADKCIKTAILRNFSIRVVVVLPLVPVIAAKGAWINGSSISLITDASIPRQQREKCPSKHRGSSLSCRRQEGGIIMEASSYTMSVASCSDTETDLMHSCR
jgi:hypothetical protein